MTTQLLFESKFDSPDLSPWNVAGQHRNGRTSPKCVEVSEGILNLYTRNLGGDQATAGWRGGSVSLPTPFTYGRFVIRVRTDPGLYTKALALLWPDVGWPPELDFMEMGGTDNWDRHKNTMNAHYGTRATHRIVHRSYLADMSTWHTVSVDWREDLITYKLDGQVMPNIWGSTTSVIENPGIDVPAHLHLTYWPHHNDDTDPWPEYESRMQVESVKVFA